REELVLADDLDAQEIHARPRLRLGQQKQPLAAADLDLQGAVVAEDRLRVERPRRRAGRLRRCPQVGGQLLQRQPFRPPHPQPPPDSSPPRGGTPLTPKWHAIAPSTTPCPANTVTRVLISPPCPTSPSRSPGRTGARKLTFSRPASAVISPLKIFWSWT